jgi:hypothetical protein
MPEQATLEEFDADEPSPDGSGRQCTATAEYSNERCERDALPGVDVCSLHLHKAEIAPDTATESDPSEERARTDGGHP